MFLLQLLVGSYLVPEVASSEQWESLRIALTWLWVFAGSIVIFGGCMLLAQALIPSLTATRDLPLRFLSFKPVFTGVGLVFLLIGLFALASFIINLMVVYDIYDRVWI